MTNPIRVAVTATPTSAPVPPPEAPTKDQPVGGGEGPLVEMSALSEKSRSLCNSVSSLSTTTSLTSCKSASSSDSTSSQSDRTSTSASSRQSDQSTDHSGKRPILKQPQSQSQLLSSRTPFSTILGTTTKRRHHQHTNTTNNTHTNNRIGNHSNSTSNNDNINKNIIYSTKKNRVPSAGDQVSIEPIGIKFKTRHHDDGPQDESTTRTDTLVANEARLATKTATIGSGSHRIYKNSPFGLTRHYLSMPGDDEANGPALGVAEPHSGSETGLKMMPLSASNLISDHHHHQFDQHHQLEHQNEHPISCQQEKLMMMIPDSASQLEAGLKRAPFEHQPQAGDDHHQPADMMRHHHRLGAKQSIASCSGKTVGDCHSKDSASSSSSKYSKCSIDGGKPVQRSSTLLVKFCSIIYATFLIILGCILHVAELRHKSRNSSDHIYSSVVALIGILWLMFLHFDLQRYKKYACKFILIESIFNDHHQAAASSAASSSAMSVSGQSLDKMSMNTEVIFKKTAMHLSSQAAAVAAMRQANKRHLAAANKAAKLTGQTSPIDGSIRALVDHGAGRKFSSAMLLASHNSLDDAMGLSRANLTNNNSMLADEDLVPAYRFLYGKMGANFYLKCGMAAFCFGHVIHEGLRFGQQVYFFMTDNYPCQDVAALVAHLITPLYSFYQLFMMFKYSNLVINRFKTVAYFGLMHIIGTSITFWFRTIIEEAFEDFVHKMDYFKASSSVPFSGGKHQNGTKTLLDAAASLINNRSTTRPGTGPQTLRSSTFLDTTPSSLFGLASENGYLSQLLSSLYTDGSATSSRLYPDSSHLNNEMRPTFAGSMALDEAEADPDTMSRESIAQSLIALMSSPVSATISPQLASHLPESYACAQNTLLTTKSMNALPYLYPFTIEYNLLLAATFLGLYFNIGRLSTTGCSNHPFRREFVHNHENGKEELEYKSNFVVNADCHAANKGLFCGFFVLLVTLVSIVIFFVTINKPSHVQLGIKINLIQETTLTVLILLVTLAGFRQVVKLNRNACLKDKVTTDDVLMLVPLPFFFIHSLLSFRAEIASLSSHQNQLKSPISSSAILNGGNRTTSSANFTTSLARLLINSTSVSSSALDSQHHQPFDYFKLITVSMHVLVMIEVLVQTNFIIDGMRRCSQSRYLRFKKPGRELITFAILLNVTYWIVATFESKSVEQYQSEIEFYGPLPWMFVSHTTLPVMLFYRYHSSVCLAEIWGRAYKPAKKVG